MGELTVSGNQIFARNLGILCADMRSVAEVCRALGFNRQQFARYLSGETMPSPYNLKRIATAFGVTGQDLLTAEEIGSVRRLRGAVHGSKPIDSLFNRAFPGDLSRLRSMLGYHHMYFMEPLQRDLVMKSLIHVHESDGKVFTKTIERVTYKEGGNHFAKFEGVMSMHGTLVFLLEVESTHAGAIVESVFFGGSVKKPDVLTGLTLGVTPDTYRKPFASPIAIKFLGKDVDVKKRLGECKSSPPDDRRLDPRIRKLFQESPAREGSAFPLTVLPPR